MNDDNFFKTLHALWIFMSLVVIGVFGVGVWAFVELVNWVTSK